MVMKTYNDYITYSEMADRLDMNVQEISRAVNTGGILTTKRTGRVARSEFDRQVKAEGVSGLRSHIYTKLEKSNSKTDFFFSLLITGFSIVAGTGIVLSYLGQL